MFRAVATACLILPFACLALPDAARADPVLECADAGSQVEIGTCVAEAEENVAEALAAALAFAAEAATGVDAATGRAEAAPALQHSQAQWEGYRAAQCAFVGATFGGGSGAGIATRSCWVILGRARVDELLAHAN